MLKFQRAYACAINESIISNVDSFHSTKVLSVKLAKILLLTTSLLISACSSAPDMPTSNNPAPNASTTPQKNAVPSPPPSPPAPRPNLVNFCTEHGGNFAIFQGVAACISDNSVCTATQYEQDKCLNFSSCVTKPAQCDPRIQPHAPNYCQNGEIITIKDGCGCVTGSLCQTK